MNVNLLSARQSTHSLQYVTPHSSDCLKQCLLAYLRAVGLLKAGAARISPAL